MKPIDPRVHALLDGELGAHEARRLREEVRAAPDACQDLGFLEQTLAGARRDLPALPEGFERRVMARVAARPAPRRGLSAWLRMPRFQGELSFAAATGLLLLGLGLVGGALFAGYHAGRAGTASGAPVAAAPAPAADPVLVRFALEAPGAKRVELVGNFNGWGARGVALAPAGNGTWVASVRLPRGHHEYTFVVDGERWVPDPAAAQLVEDGFGGHNAVIEL